MAEGGSEFYGVAAEFCTPEALCAAAAAVRAQRFGITDVFSPLPIPGINEALGMRQPFLGWIALGGVLVGGFGCFGMITLATVVSYPFVIAGRPLLSWPYYVIPSFATAMLTASVLVFAAMLFLDRLPRLNHPVFNIDGIAKVTDDRLFLAVEARSAEFDPAAVERFLSDLPQPPIRLQRIPR